MNINIKLNTLTAEVSPLVWEHTDNEQIIVKLLPTSLAKNKVCLVWNKVVYEFRDNLVYIPVSAFLEVNQLEVRDFLADGTLLRRWRCNPLTVLKEIVDGREEVRWREERELYNKKLLPLIKNMETVTKIIAEQQEKIQGLSTGLNEITASYSNLLGRVKELEGIDLFSEET